jgi:hypothetical protein
MQGFSSSFLIFFQQIALGGLLAISATPFHELERAFYKSTGGVLFVIALFGLWGKNRIYWELVSQGLTWGSAAEIFFHVAFVSAFACYMISLWSDWPRFRARSFSTSIITGLVGLSLNARSFYDAPGFSLESLIYAGSFIVSALLLGSVTVGMLIGHWYLIDTGQSLDPFIRIYKFFVIALLLQAAYFLIVIALLYFHGAPQIDAGFARLWKNHSTLLTLRVLVGQIAPLILSGMIWRTLQIPHTMAATGLFYMALLGVFVGEILGRQILALTSLPL